MAFKKYEKKEERDYQQEITDRFKARLKEAEECIDKGLKWEKPFFDNQGLPFNALTGEKYRGGNIVALWSEQRNDPRWLTFAQMKEYEQKHNTKLHLEKGSSASFVMKVVPAYEKLEDGTVKKDEQGKPIPITHADGTPKIGFKWYPVFNCEDIKGIEPYIKPNLDVKPAEAVEMLSKALQERTGLKVVETDKTQAYYSPAEHKVHMPKPEYFKSTEAYNDTKLHEFGHCSGRDLKRDLTGRFGAEGEAGKKYAFEELCAEITSSFMSHELGLKHDPSQHENQGAYIKSWLKALDDDKTMITRAGKHASDSTDYQMNHLNSYIQEQEQKQAKTKETTHEVKIEPKKEKVQEQHEELAMTM